MIKAKYMTILMLLPPACTAAVLLWAATGF